MAQVDLRLGGLGRIQQDDARKAPRLQQQARHHQAVAAVVARPAQEQHVLAAAIAAQQIQQHVKGSARGGFHRQQRGQARGEGGLLGRLHLGRQNRM